MGAKCGAVVGVVKIRSPTIVEEKTVENHTMFRRVPRQPRQGPVLRIPPRPIRQEPKEISDFNDCEAHADKTIVSELLPFRLQDLCLLKVVNDLDSYSIELLSCLPLWTRRRLLNSIPVVDLYRLDGTPITEGVDMENVWRAADARVAPIAALWQHLSEGDVNPWRHPFELSIRNRDDRKRSLSYELSTQYYLNTDYILESTFKNWAEEMGRDNLRKPRSNRDAVMLKILTGVLSTSGPASRQRLLTLVSLDGGKLLPSLRQGFKINRATCYLLWLRQATALSIDQHRWYSKAEWNTILTPTRLKAARFECDRVQQMTFLTINCFPQPETVNLQLTGVADDITKTLDAGWFYGSAGLNVSPKYELCMSGIRYLLKKVQILRLGCTKYNNEAGVVVSVINALMSDKNKSALKYLFCSLPNVYTDIVRPIFYVFSLPNFRHLYLDLEELYPLSISKIMQVYFTSSCPHVQTLSLRINSSVAFSTIHRPNLASLDMGGATVPECAIDHKNLNVSSGGILSFLLHMPVVRVNEICMDGSDIIHHCAMHPDLRVRKLTVAVGTYCRQNRELSLTYKEDFESLLTMPSLQEVTVCVQLWCDTLNIALTKGFSQRAELSLPPLRKISLRPNGQSKPLVVEGVRPLWDAIFSLPEIEQLELIVGDGFLDFDTMRTSWLAGKRHQLRSITIVTGKREMKTDVLPDLTPNLFVNSKQVRKIEYAFDEDDWF